MVYLDEFWLVEIDWWCNYYVVYIDIFKVMIVGFYIVRDWGEFGVCWIFVIKSKIVVYEKIGD